MNVPQRVLLAIKKEIPTGVSSHSMQGEQPSLLETTSRSVLIEHSAAELAWGEFAKVKSVEAAFAGTDFQGFEPGDDTTG